MGGMQISLYDRTLALLANRKCPLELIAQGAGVGESWLQKFSRRKIPNASAVRVQRVHDFLAKHDFLTSPSPRRPRPQEAAA